MGEDSPAERAGIESGDIIVEVDGESIEVSADLPHVIGLISPGQSVSMVLIRDGDEEALDVEIGALEAGQTPSVVASVSDSRALTSPLSLVRTPASVRWPQPDRAAQEPQAELLMVSTQTPVSSTATTLPDSMISMLNAGLQSASPRPQSPGQPLVALPQSR